MKPHYFLITVLLLFSGSVYSQNDFEIRLLKQFHTIRSEEIMTWVEKFCSPEFMDSAEWVAGKLKEYGIKPGGDNGNYFQCMNNPYTDPRNPEFKNGRCRPYQYSKCF